MQKYGTNTFIDKVSVGKLKKEINKFEIPSLQLVDGDYILMWQYIQRMDFHMIIRQIGML